MTAATPVLRAEEIRRAYPLAGRLVEAVRGLSLEVLAGEWVAVVGPSGCGKSTLLNLLGAIDRPTAGRIVFEGEDLSRLTPAAMRRLRARIQMVFQDPQASLNPRMSVHDIVTEPLIIHREQMAMNARQRTERALELLQMVGLGEQHLYRHPHEFSGGQRQRIGIARALATSPALLLLDEPTSALDVSVQAQVLNLLIDLQQRLGLTYFFISHDLGVIRYVCDRVALIHHGRLVEEAPCEQLFESPHSDYARSLLAAMPQIETGA